MYFSSPKFEGEDTEAKVICNRTLFFSPAVGFHYRIRNGTTSMQDVSERFTTYLIFGFIMNEHRLLSTAHIETTKKSCSDDFGSLYKVTVTSGLT
jgi:hypothetical protein